MVVAAVFTILRVLIAAHGHVDGLILPGSQYVSRTSYTSRLPIMSNNGYDGQFYYRLALDPLDWSVPLLAFGWTPWAGSTELRTRPSSGCCPPVDRRQSP